MRLEVPPEAAGMRLDTWLAAASGLGRGEVQRLAELGRVRVDGATVAKSLRVRPGQAVEVEPLAAPAAVRAPAPYEVRYEDGDLVVVAKPAGVVVHPPGARDQQTLAETLAGRMPLAAAGGADRPGIVHRLDRGTSGLMVVAKTDDAYRALADAVRGRRVERTYLALVLGSFRMPTGRIEAPVGRSVRDPKRMEVTAAGRAAATTFRALEALGPCTLVEVTLETGRTHQIRVHMAHVGHPVVGDATYGRRTLALAAELGLGRGFLHAARLRFPHPGGRGEVDVTEPLPPDLEAALERARTLPGARSGSTARRGKE